MTTLYLPPRSALVQHLLGADGGDVLVVAVPLDVAADDADERRDGDGQRSVGTARDAAGEGDERGSQAQSGSGSRKLDVSHLHDRGTIARVRQLTRVAQVHLSLPLHTRSIATAHMYTDIDDLCKHLDVGRA